MKKHLFTLIEMLVVIAIIGILASLLMPSLHKALDLSRSVSCQNNLKNLYIMSNSYASDYDNQLAPVYIVTSYGERVFSQFMTMYTDNPAPLSYWSESQLKPYLEKSVFSCSSIKDFFLSEYGMNFESMLENSDWSGRLLGIKLTKLKYPTKTRYLTDAYNDEIFGSQRIVWYGVSNSTTVNFRHNDYTNLLLMDGHVNSYDRFSFDANTVSY